MNAIEDVIAGLEDANIDAEQKQGLMLQIQQEGGVVSEGLKQSLIAVFEHEAENARNDAATSTEALNEIASTPYGPSTEDDNSAAIVADIGKKQALVLADVDQMSQEMKADVMRMANHSLKNAEEIAEAGNRQHVETIRASLLDADGDLTN